jgi:hypothetical protein
MSMAQEGAECHIEGLLIDSEIIQNQKSLLLVLPMCRGVILTISDAIAKPEFSSYLLTFLTSHTLFPPSFYPPSEIIIPSALSFPLCSVKESAGPKLTNANRGQLCRILKLLHTVHGSRRLPPS